jgi:isoquinoline 1-oxidoreductase subunit beta
MPTWVACVARVRVDRASGGVMVEKRTLVVDAGTIVYPDGDNPDFRNASYSCIAHRGT